jgi:hypothetical protein
MEADNLVILVQPPAPPKRGAPSDVKRWPGTFTFRVAPDALKAFKHACWKKNLDPAGVLRDFMDAFASRYK